MIVRIRHKPATSNGSVPFAVSGWIHGFILAYVALSPASTPAPRSLYEQQIQPSEKRLIWYHMRDKLPDISPGETKKSRLPRAQEKSKQTIVAGPKDLPGPRQLISMPAPEIQTPDALPLPNVVAMAPKAPPKLFAPPTPKPVSTAPSPLAEAPVVTPVADPKRSPIESSAPKAEPKAFRPPPTKKQEAKPDPVLPDAPAVDAKAQLKPLPLAVGDARAPLRKFTPTQSARAKLAEPNPLPDAPTISTKVPNQNLPIDLADPKAPRRAFTPPAAKRAATEGSAALPDAPRVEAAAGAASNPLAVAETRAPRRSYSAPAGTRARTAPAPELPNAPDVERVAASPPEASLAIVGMNPVRAPDFPTPPGSRQAGFSAGPEVRPKGGDQAGETSSTIVVPGLLVRGGEKDSPPRLIANAAPTSRETLRAAAREALHSAPPEGATPGAALPATRLSNAPDPRLEGRAVYTVAIQMPNITSYSGSWIVWFAEREPQTGRAPIEIRAPLPLRKVDPKYVAAAAEEKVEGTVRLSAIIRKDGSVDSVTVIKRLDDRLDASAREALAKWLFKPAMRNSTAIDIDAVFEIPFHLAPKPVR